MIRAGNLTAARLKAWRAAAGWSQKVLATRAGIHVQTVKYWERQQGLIAGHAVDRFAAAFAAARVALPSENRRATDERAAPIEQPRKDAAEGKCGARTRKGQPCRASTISGKRRCKFHGGMSTGPRTIEGRQRIREAMLRRWQAFRCEQVPSPEHLAAA